MEHIWKYIFFGATFATSEKLQVRKLDTEDLTT